MREGGVYIFEGPVVCICLCRVPCKQCSAVPYVSLAFTCFSGLPQSGISVCQELGFRECPPLHPQRRPEASRARRRRKEAHDIFRREVQVGQIVQLLVHEVVADVRPSFAVGCRVGKQVLR